MSWVAIIMDPDDNNVKIVWFYLKKIVLDTIRGGQFLYISLEFSYKHSSCCYSICLLILDPYSQCILSLLYCLTSFIFTFHV